VGPHLAPLYIPKSPDGLPATANNQFILAPAYPNTAINRGFDGYVIVGFRGSASGSVFDAFIIESEPSSIFDRSAMKAISKFKYKAKMVDGKPAAIAGQVYLFRYELDKQS
jgi:protein TonB